MRWFAILFVYAYRACIRPFLRRRCLFAESCSAFGIRMFRCKGLQHGVPLVIARIASCRMPAAACFVLDPASGMRLLSVTPHPGLEIPPRALELLAQEG